MWVEEAKRLKIGLTFNPFRSLAFGQHRLKFAAVGTLRYYPMKRYEPGPSQTVYNTKGTRAHTHRGLI